MASIASPEKDFMLPTYAAQAAEKMAIVLSPSSASTSSSFDFPLHRFLDLEALEESDVDLSSLDSYCNSSA